MKVSTYNWTGYNKKKNPCNNRIVLLAAVRPKRDIRHFGCVETYSVIAYLNDMISSLSGSI